MLTRIEVELFKTESGEFAISKLPKFAALLDKLASGRYKLIIETEPARLVKMKKYYFTMETKLSLHLGMKKPELHEALKKHVGQAHNYETGELEYESIKDVKDEQVMMERIYEFQQYAILEHKFQFEPFYEEDRDKPGTIQVTDDGINI